MASNDTGTANSRSEPPVAGTPTPRFEPNDSEPPSMHSELPVAGTPIPRPEPNDSGFPQKRSEPFGAKAELIRRLPPDMPAKQVVEEGRKVGLQFNAAYVYRLRSRDQAKSKTARPQPHAGGPPAFRQDEDGLVARLRSAIIQIGLVRAREVFEEIEAEFGP